MKQYEKWVIEVITWEEEDIITVSPFIEGNKEGVDTEEWS